ncbi:Phosphoenolpyruvate/pyruvate domain-containing protein [Aspergillus vadensis CBS 113365]|uniref:Phosphoenolpyruvate/pyruvate domain-containing protein n=1 Tax=Aspergillus vadensis (strain CBS 113365 / IMI 142717 / IBT 24658) TaxID=1448311 RepID=A0A319BLY2_ASPVC|nr:Phosphoenolpyruvate/pyruvate domain-containing protein [Aspergillus vadensis CBS 113365]PYH73344.1 Phosphoenolpyruvate/pyruvate domain-containing protein [Aspergillus vadensis CBS 113365]
MTPFCRTVGETEKALQGLADNGLQVYVIFETPSNVVLAEQFLGALDAFSIGLKDLTQLTLVFIVLRIARRAGCKVGIYGQAPSDQSELSVISGRFADVKRQVVASEQRQIWKKADGSGDNKWIQ